MKFFEALLEVPERAGSLDIRASKILNLLCAATFTTEFPEGVDFDEIDDLVSQMTELDGASASVKAFVEKVKGLPVVQSAGSLFI